MSRITDLIVKLKSERPEAKLGQQLYAIPQKENDMIAGQSFYYYVGDRRRTAVNFQNEIGLHLNWLKFKRVTPLQYRNLQDSMTPMEELISRDYIYPFLLFINGRMIRWEYITIIVTQERYDILISGMNQTIFDTYFKGAIKSAYVVMLPDGIEYKDGGFATSNKTLFAFDETGLLVKNGTARTVIDNYDSDVSVIGVDVTTDPIFVFSEENQYSYFSESVCVFNNGLYDGVNDISVLSSAIKVNGGTLSTGDSLHVRVFFNKDSTPSYNNISRVALNGIRTDVLNTLRGQAPPEYLNILSIPFDITMDKNKGYEENRSISLNKIAQYNPLFFNEYYMKQRQFATYEVNYDWIQSHLNEDGRLQIPRRFEDGSDYFIIMLVNGELYKYYQNHFYNAGWFICPVVDIEQGDIIELWYFKNARNFELTGTVSSDQEYLPLDTENYYIDDNLRIFCKQASDTHGFVFPSDGLQQFPVDYALEYNSDHSGFRVRFDDPFYYGKPLTFVSSDRFKYAGFSIKLDPGKTDVDFYKINLGKRFEFCNEYDRFLVFYNGRRLMNDHYRLILPNRPTTPFVTCEIYLTIPLKENDRIDVFYLPHHFNDIYQSTDDLDTTGLITIDKSSLPFVLDKHLFTFWLNGKKIPNSAIKNFDSNKVQIISDQKSLKTLRVTSMITDKAEYDELKTLFQTYDSYWDQILRLYTSSPYKLLDISENIVLTNTEADYFVNAVEPNIIMRELLRDQYAGNLVVDTTGPFIYDYDDVDQSAIVGTDPAGNLLFDICDANLQNNLDVDRYSP